MKRTWLGSLVQVVWLPLAAALIALYVFLAVSYFRTLVTGSPWEPGQGISESIVKPALRQGEPLTLKVSTAMDQRQCDVYVQRAVINSDGDIVFQRVFKISDTRLENMANGETAFVVRLPRLAVGQYYYRADVYLNCPGGRSFVRNSGLLPFEILP